MQLLVDVRGLPAVRLALIRVNKREVTAVVRAALTQLVKPIAVDMRLLAPVDTGALKASIGVRQYTRRGMLFAVIGVRRKFKRFGRTPSRYAHLIEYGVPSRGIAAQSFIRRTWDVHKLTFATRFAFLIRAGLHAKGII